MPTAYEIDKTIAINSHDCVIDLNGYVSQSNVCVAVRVISEKPFLANLPAILFNGVPADQVDTSGADHG